MTVNNSSLLLLVRVKVSVVAVVVSSRSAELSISKMAEGGSNSDNSFVKKLDFSAENQAVRWKTFKSQFNMYKIAKGYEKLGEKEQIANMLVLMGSDSVPIYEQFTFGTGDDAETLTNAMSKFDTHFEPVKNIIYERVKFNQMKQESTQSIHQFIVALRSQAENCDYGDKKDELVRDRIVVGVRDSKLREYLIDVDNLNLTLCIQKAKQFVSHHDQASKMSLSSSTFSAENVDQLTKAKDQKRVTKWTNLKSKCPRCSKFKHWEGKCPADSKTCYVCNQKGHFAKSKACRLDSGKVNAIETASNVDSHMEGLFLASDSD